MRPDRNSVPAPRRRVRALLPAAALAAAAGCDAQEPVREYRIGSATYGIPPEHIASVRDEPEPFIRIRPPEAPYELVYDSRLAGGYDARGNPLIFSVSDEDGGSVRRVRVGDSIVLCRAAANPRGGCGVRLPANDADWSVLIPQGRVDEAEALVALARADLEAYRIR